MKTETIKISKIKSNPNNPRLIKDDKFFKLVKSIKEFPEMLKLRPIVVNDDLIVLGGNMRLKACKDAGLKEVSIIKASELTAEQQREFIVKDNVGFGEWDWNMIANEWDTEQLDDWGLDLPVDFNVVEEEAEEDDYVEPDDLKVDVVLGDLIEIGEHRLLCGDSTDSDQVAKLMNGEKADVAHNDPPYGMKKENDGVLNDNLNYSDLLNFNKEWIPLQWTHLKENGSFYCWGIDEPLMDIYFDILKPYIKNKKATFRNLITWDKGTGQGQNSERTRSYATADEKCLFVAMGLMGETINGEDYKGEYDNVLNYLKEQENKCGLSKSEMKDILGQNMYSHYMTNSQFTLISEIKFKALQEKTGFFKKPHTELKKLFEQAKNEIRSKQFYFNNVHDNMNNVWHFDRHVRQGNEGGHATPKPIPLCERVIKSSCPDGGLVIDSFLGSGSTMVASHQLKRKCYGMELDPKYCQVIIDRMKKLDDTLQIKINGKEYGGS
jgi:DNA modification methylase